MLVKMKIMMNVARDNHFGIPAVSAQNEHALRACIAAAEKKNSPLIILSGFASNDVAESWGRIATDLIRESSMPIAIILDHGPSYEKCLWAIRAGFTDVMIDASSKPFEENAAVVKKVVDVAHVLGVGVEAELGHVGMGDNYAVDGYTALTVPEEAVRFVEETGVDALAVAVGTAHGVYKGTPEIRFELLKELREKVPVPLVMHGGSGSGDENISKSCQLGICKVNIANDLYKAAIKSLLDGGTEGNAVYGMYRNLGKGYEDKVAEYTDICGSAGKADLVLEELKKR